MEMKSEIEERKLIIMRNQLVVKHNNLIQESRYELSVPEQRMIAFIISLIKPPEKNKIQPLVYEFNIKDYCLLCGINKESGRNYENIKNTVKKLRDSSIWLKDETGEEVTASWFSKVWISQRKGIVRVKLDEDLVPYLLALKENTTRYQLLNILPMSSQYSIRLYELASSYKNANFFRTYEYNELKYLLMIDEDKYPNLKNFKQKVLNIAKNEINKYTDLNVDFYTKSRKNENMVVMIVEKKDDEEINKSLEIIQNKLGY